MTAIETLLNDSDIEFTVLHDGDAWHCPCCGVEAAAA